MQTRHQTQRSDIQPTRAQVHAYFAQGDHVPVYRTLLADLETPVSVYLKLKQAGQPAFLLESVEGGEQVGRYSFIGVNPKGVISVKDNVATIARNGEQTRFAIPKGQDPLHVIQRHFQTVSPVALDGLPRLVGGAVGYMSYDIVRYFEDLPATASDDLDVPTAAFMLPDTLVIFDHAMHQLIVLANAHNTSDDADAAYDEAVGSIDAIVAGLSKPLAQPVYGLPARPERGDPASNVERHVHEERVRMAKEYIRDGDAFQIVLAQRFSRDTEASPLQIYRALRATNPSPYMFLLEFSDELTLVGASPEMLVRLEDGIAYNRPLAGTRRRGKDEQEDLALEAELLNDPKERAEHVMLVDLGRNDLGRVCEYGTVQVKRMMYIERYSHVMHIVSQIEGRLRKDMDAFDLVRATFPAGTLSGAPKVRAMEIIEELEGTRRGPYGGAVGYFSFDGSMDMCIAIRTLLMQGKRISVQAGGGIVADSDPSAEYDETINKATAVFEAVKYAERGLM
ncbi:MAG: anthranilate synthase component I [Chloroflexi bacterium]|nr:anthranilate synthase component I [Chloroflexota bacterium]MCY4247923.1 anthranilate synthase component I [Chloroflexota bacterium]